MNPTSKGIAVVTGASAGIGAVYAERLAQRGYDLLLVARNVERLEKLAGAIAWSTGRKVEILGADLSDAADLAKVEQRLREDQQVTMLVNNAGVGATAPLLNSDIGAMAQMISLNIEVLTRLTYAAVPGLVARGSGTIINIASIAAIAPEILNGVYGGSKAFVLAFSQSLQHELADKGIRVQVVLPGATATNFWSTAGTPVEHLPQEIVMPVEAMVDAALAGLDQGEFATIPALPDAEQWTAYETARIAMMPNLSRTAPADRYGSVSSRA
ncbi:SDR family NAD(P)-dependent oxidoreductase [Paludibaculum fermentans]|uniref:NADP-dependent 3-hydroxy acid dehydrogenase YdfG n=1 Tax=Paludibaculum fermentans TaxID=1473598 RepID=A0A7S7NRI8_PALFE|nr:SDR family oxidoreductase [Paludibaculum fermentans]QOY88361.1 SDR family oxidoreductase [Paludibaculum fermentans]